MSDEIVELLKNKKLRTEVVQTIKDVYSYAGTLHDNPTEDMEEDLKRYGEESRWEEAWWRAETYGDAQRIEQAFKKHVFDKMQKPYRISPEEIIGQFYSMAIPGGIGCPELENIDFDNLYTIFISYVNLHILSHRCSDPFPICIVPDDRKEFVQGLLLGYQAALAKLKGEDFQPPDLDGHDDGEATLWCKNGVRVRLLGRRYFRTRYYRERLFYLDAIVDGRMSNLACEQLQAEISRILSTVIRSASLLWPVDDASTLPRRLDELPLVKEDLLQRKKVLIKKCLDMYYSKPSKKDSIDRRIRNAVHLLIESDAQSNDAVGLALSVTAIDALLGEKSAEISEKLSMNVAVLLEPDLNRRQNATKFVKDMYNLRSEVLHGAKTEGEKDFRVKARHLVAGVLSAIISRRDFLKRAGYDPESPQELLKGLRELRFTPVQPIGIEETNVRELWTDN
ncbi:MAG: hypothetical protein FVQ85_19510 [Planctomycetes bacterium]|nr:hypothetical protein [Planctomycetota bacterium]